jgi:Phosphotransferase enzyme family
LYRAGQDRVLHLYANPSERLRRSLADRESIRMRSRVQGIPRVCAVAETVDALWIVEEFVPGRVPDMHSPGQWFGAAADWAVGMACPPARPLRDVPEWGEHCNELLARTPPELGERVLDAVAAVSRLPAVHMHGDLQRRNLLMDGSRIGAVDWEGAWLEGLPGLDLVFLALYAGSDTPDEHILARLMRGEDAPWGGLRDALASVGVSGSALRPALVVMLGTWALAEDRRLARLGAPPGPRVYRPLFHRWAAA